MRALSQHCASNFLVECCLRCFWTTLTRQYSYAWLTQYCVGHFLHTKCQLVVKLSMLSKRLQKTAQEEILFKVVLIPNTAQVKTLSNIVHEKIQFNVAYETPDNIAQKKTQWLFVWLSTILLWTSNFLTTGWYKCHANIAQISTALHKNNPGLKLNKKTTEQ